MMDKIIEELQFQVPLKEVTEPGDTVIFLRETENGQVSISYARVLDFEPDLSKRDEWWHVRFVFFEIPPLPRTIILQTAHFTGREVFTMGGRKVFIKAVNFEAFKSEQEAPPPGDPPPARPARRGQAPKAKDSPGKPTFTLIK